MKKMRLNCGIRPRDQIIRKMKVTVFLLTISILGTFASGTYSQTTKLTLQFDNTALEKVLGEIENQSEFRFFYNENVNVRKEVTVSSQNESVFEILDYILGGTGIKYRIIGRQIALYNQDESFNLPYFFGYTIRAGGHHFPAPHPNHVALKTPRNYLINEILFLMSRRCYVSSVRG